MCGAASARCCSAPATADSRRIAAPPRRGTVPVLAGGAAWGRASLVSTLSKSAAVVIAFQSSGPGRRFVRVAKVDRGLLERTAGFACSAHSSIACDIRSVGPRGCGEASSALREGASALILLDRSRNSAACLRSIQMRLRLPFHPSSGW